MAASDVYENPQMAYAHAVDRHRCNFDDAWMTFTRTQHQPIVLVSESSNTKYQNPHTHSIQNNTLIKEGHPIKHIA